MKGIGFTIRDARVSKDGHVLRIVPKTVVVVDCSAKIEIGLRQLAPREMSSNDDNLQ